MTAHTITMSSLDGPIKITIKPWTGGSEPRPWLEVGGTMEGALVCRLFDEQMDDFRAAWGDIPDAATRNTFWSRARHDAHATMRRGGKD